MNINYTYLDKGTELTLAIYFELAPVASFEVDSASPPTDTAEPVVTVQFNDMSTNNPSSFSWNFGDGSTSTLQSPDHPFTAAGTYPVTLKVYNTLGQEADSYTLDYTVKVPTITYQASAGANGVITPSGTVIVDEGSTTTFTIAPEPESLPGGRCPRGRHLGLVRSRP